MLVIWWEIIYSKGRDPSAQPPTSSRLPLLVPGLLVETVLRHFRWVCRRATFVYCQECCECSCTWLEHLVAIFFFFLGIFLFSWPVHLSLFTLPQSPSFHRPHHHHHLMLCLVPQAQEIFSRYQGQSLKNHQVRCPKWSRRVSDELPTQQKTT